MLIIIIVFVPLLTLQGLEGKLFIPVALAIIFALAGSLLLALTVTRLRPHSCSSPRRTAIPPNPRSAARLRTCSGLGVEQ